jgi:hypothetical protein
VSGERPLWSRAVEASVRADMAKTSEAYRQGLASMKAQDGEGLHRDAGRLGDWSQTYTGKRFYVADPRPEDVDIIDIAHALSMMCRYSGHVSMFYSVAEHSLLVSHMVPPEDALCGLLHDATEAYLSDLTRPVKRTLGEDNLYFDLERTVWCRAIVPAFGLPLDLPQSVKDADLEICASEKATLMPRSSDWNLPKDFRLMPVRGRAPYSARHRFLGRFAELTGVDYPALMLRVRDYGDQDVRKLWMSEA